MTASGALLKSKLYPPRLSSRLVTRVALMERLNERRDCPVTLITAPPGYGKSTLALQWLQAGADKFAWLSLDENDSSLPDLVAYLIAALQTVASDVGHDTALALQSPQIVNPERLADMLLAELDDLDAPTTVVLDDYHAISDPAAHRFLGRFLYRLPEGLRVVILSRTVPPLELSRLRGQGRLQEVYAIDLQFSVGEAAALMNNVARQQLPPEVVTLLAERTEGWPLGLHLAALSMRDSAEVDDFAARFAADGNRAVTDYLLSEVLDRLTERQRGILLRLSVLERFCAPLIDYTLQTAASGIDSQTLLDALWSANAFVVALDDQGTWYRFHHLFRQLIDRQLRRAFSAEEIGALHARAGEWLERNGLIEEAIAHMLRAGEPDRAARIVEHHVEGQVNREQWRLVERWTSMLPAETRQRPGMLVTQALVEQFRLRIQVMATLLEQARAGLDAGLGDYSPKEQTTLRAKISSLSSSGLMVGNTPQTIKERAEFALEHLDPSSTYIYSVAELWQVCALQMEGHAQEAVELVRKRLDVLTDPTSARTMRMFLGLCYVHHNEIDLPGMRAAGRDYLDAARRAEQVISTGWANFVLGWAAYQSNDLGTARGYFAHSIADRFRLHARTVIDSYTGMALLEHALGNREGSAAVLESMREFLLEQELVPLLPVADSLHMRLFGGGGAVFAMIAGMDGQMALGTWELPVLTACRVMIADGRPRVLVEAGALLDSIYELAASRNSKVQLLQTGLLQVLLLCKLGRDDEALARLRAMVQMSEPGYALRYYADAGLGTQIDPTSDVRLGLVPLLRALAEEDADIAPTTRGYIGRILATFGETLEGPATTTATAMGGTVPLLAVDLLGQLTNRELDVLTLLANRLSNKEIAAQLFISPRTVKKHTVNLYHKLDVSGRREAVARARALGLI